MKKRDEIKKLIQGDLYRYCGNDKIDSFAKMRLYGWQYLKTWRRASYYAEKNQFMYFVYGYLLYRKFLKYGFQISPHAKIGNGLYLGHFGTVIVGDEVEIGCNVNINPNVVIGRANRGKIKGSPKIGNSVWIGSGAVLVGNISIGDNVLIAPNAYVNFDVPKDSIVVGNPGTIHSSLYATDDYISNRV